MAKLEEPLTTSALKEPQDSCAGGAAVWTREGHPLRAVSLSEAFGRLAAHPLDLLRRWNWKSAVMSSLIRGGIFFGTNLTAGWNAAVAAMLTELVYRSATAGFYGALTQTFRRVEPAWRASLAVLVVLPFANHVFEFLVHWMRGTEKLFLSAGVSVAFTVLSSLFNFFVMRRGLMVVGQESQTLLADMAQMPKAIAVFVALPFAGLWRLARAWAAASVFPAREEGSGGFPVENETGNRAEL